MASGSKRHLRTESQAVKELENVFKSVDLEGDGKLDMASFQTAMYSLDVSAEDEKMEELFHSVDTSRQGFIRYEDFLKLLKKGRLSHNRTAQEVIKSAKAAPPSLLPSNSVEAMRILPSGFEVPKKKMDAKKKTTINRAVIVIKKAAMKDIAREEVVEFLKDKGMKDDDINYAYEKASEQAMSLEERIRYLKTQISTKDKELFDQKAFTRHLSDEAQRKSAQVNILRAACLKAAGRLLEQKPKEEAKTDPPEDVLKEVTERMNKLRENMQSLNEKSADLLAKDMKKMEKLEACLKTGRNFCSYLLLMSLEPIMQNTLRKTQIYLSEWE